MMGCHRVRGLVAASVYEDLSEKDQRVLDRHLASCAACRSEAEAFAELAAQIPDVRPELACDLAPDLRRRLDEEGVKTGGRGLRGAFAGASCVLLVAIIGAGVLLQRSPGPTTASDPGKMSFVEAKLAEAETLLNEAHEPDPMGAYRMLAQAVERYPEDPVAGEAQIRLADLAFDELGWWEEAHEAYQTLRRDYQEVLEANKATVVFRLNLLDQARKVNYESLNRLEAAKRSAEAFEELETVLAQYRATYVASLAAEEMARLVCETYPFDTGAYTLVEALEEARDYCTDPVAVAQLQYEIGLVCWEQLNDFERARDLLQEVAESEDQALSQLASACLASLEASARASAPGP